MSVNDRQQKNLYYWERNPSQSHFYTTNSTLPVPESNPDSVFKDRRLTARAMEGPRQLCQIQYEVTEIGGLVSADLGACVGESA